MFTPNPSEVVSDDKDLLVLVNSNDEEIGLLDKVSCHVANGVLHRAVSVFILNSNGEVLLQKRHDSKALWGGYWSNACCSHPHPQESALDAATRRVGEELGLTLALEFCFKFEYQATFDSNHAEHELCSVFIGGADRDPVVNDTEISDWRWVPARVLDRYMLDENMPLTPWLRLEWQQLRASPDVLRRYTNA